MFTSLQSSDALFLGLVIPLPFISILIYLFVPSVFFSLTSFLLQRLYNFSLDNVQVN